MLLADAHSKPFGTDPKDVLKLAEAALISGPSPLKIIYFIVMARSASDSSDSTPYGSTSNTAWSALCMAALLLPVLGFLSLIIYIFWYIERRARDLCTIMLPEPNQVIRANYSTFTYSCEASPSTYRRPRPVTNIREIWLRCNNNKPSVQIQKHAAFPTSRAKAVCANVAFLRAPSTRPPSPQALFYYCSNALNETQTAAHLKQLSCTCPIPLVPAYI